MFTPIKEAYGISRCSYELDWLGTEILANTGVVRFGDPYTAERAVFYPGPVRMENITVARRSANASQSVIDLAESHNPPS